jgi:hypothetical protein
MLNLNSTTPMRSGTRSNGLGIWETDFVMETYPFSYFRICSTFQPNVALKPGRVDMLELKFNLQMDSHYTVTSSYDGRR